MPFWRSVNQRYDVVVKKLICSSGTFQKQTSSTAEKSFAVGTLAEVIESIGETTVVFVDTLYPVFLRMVKDEDDEVRSNAVFALGMLAANGGDKMKAWVDLD